MPTPQFDPEIKKKLKKEDLVYCADSTPGYFRQGKKEFTYYDLEGNKIKDKKTLKRIESLVIPPSKNPLQPLL